MGIISCAWVVKSWWQGNHQMNELPTAALTFFAVIIAISWLLWAAKGSRNAPRPLPPGPRGLPLLGNLLSLEPDLHRHFAKLAKVYGPIIKLRLGNKLCVVVSSPSLAKEVLKDQDTTFANRDIPAVAQVLSYGGLDLGWAPYGSQWRMLRKIFVRDMMSNKCLDACSGLRRREVRRMVRDMHGKIGSPVDVGEQTFVTTFDVTTSMLWGDALKGKESSTIGVEFHNVVAKMNELLSKPNISDLFPALARFDIRGLARRMKKYLSWVDQTLDTIIDGRERETETRRGRGIGEGSRDFLELLLQIRDEADPKTPLTTTHIKALIVDILLAGTLTTSATIEWAMAEMLLHPEVMIKAQEELDQVVGINNTVEESHLPKLQYLDAILKEVHRLRPVGPLLLPRSPSQSCNVGGYLVPKGSKVLVNVWAIQRSPEAWDNPLEFQPERFLNENGKWDYKGNDYRYFPFGSGRRICAGLPVAEKMLMFVLATLLHSFEWRLPEQTTVDLTEELSIALKKAKPLFAIPAPRLQNRQLYV